MTKKLEIVTVNEIIIFGQKFMSKSNGWYYPLDEEGKFTKRVDKKKEVLKEIKNGLDTLDKFGQRKDVKSIRLSAKTAAFALFSGELDRKAEFTSKGKWVECTTKLNGHPHPVRIYPQVEEGIYAIKDEKII